MAAITSNVHLADAPGNVVLPVNSVGLARESVVNVSQLLTLDRDVLSKPSPDLAEIAPRDGRRCRVEPLAPRLTI